MNAATRFNCFNRWPGAARIALFLLLMLGSLATVSAAGPTAARASLLQITAPATLTPGLVCALRVTNDPPSGGAHVALRHARDAEFGADSCALRAGLRGFLEVCRGLGPLFFRQGDFAGDDIHAHVVRVLRIERFERARGVVRAAEAQLVFAV